MRKCFRAIITLVTLVLISSCNFVPKNVTYASRLIAAQKVGSIVIAWAPSSGNPQGYKVEQSTNGDDFYQIQMVTLPTATITLVVPGTTYYFRIRSYNEAGDSAYSGIISATVN